MTRTQGALVGALQRFLLVQLGLALLATAAWGQQVVTAKVRTGSGERVLRVTTTLRQSPETVWKSFSTEEGLKCWIAPVVRLDLRTGGSLATNYNKTEAIGGPGTITLTITNYVENEELTFKVKLNESFSAKLRSEDDRLQEVIQLQRMPDGGTRVVSSMVGWGTGEDWDKALDFFARGNEWTYKNLARCLSTETP